MEPDLSKLAFYTGENYMKREERNIRYVDVTVPAFGSNSADLVHGLLLIPEYEVGGNLDSGSGIWTGTLPYVGQSGSGGGAVPFGAILDSWITETTLTVYVSHQSAIEQTYRIYYIIYRDYA